jgi:ankyrin repeat protein
MGPKKKGGAKKKAKSEDDGQSSMPAVPEVILLPSFEEQLKTTTLLQTVGSRDTKTLTRLVAHYNYSDTLLKADMNGTTMLMMAAKNGDVAGVDKLLSMQSQEATNIDAKEITCVGGHTALHHACMNGSVAVVEMLCRYGANPDIQSSSALGETPLQLCVKNGEKSLGCARMLLSMGAKPGAVDKYANTATFWANSNGNNWMVKELNLPTKGTSADQLMKLVMGRIPNFSLPAAKKGKKKAKGKKKK